MSSNAILYQRISGLPAYLREHLLDYINLLEKSDLKIGKKDLKKIDKKGDDLIRVDKWQEIDKMLKEIQKLNVFNSITNPVDWQKEHRDEWESRIAG